MKLSIVIPVYNEQDTIAKVLQKLLDVSFGLWTKEIIVINDCSTDDTAKIVRKYKTRSEIKTVTHDKNKGKGAAIRSGLELTTGDYIIIQDADLEYNPNDISKLVSMAKLHPNAAIFGSRFLAKHEDTVFGHRTANYFLTLFTNILYGTNLSDMETCYKLIPGKVYSRIELKCERFDFEPEITSKILKLGVPIVEVPISFRKRGYSEGKKIKWHDGVAALWTLLKFRF